MPEGAVREAHVAVVGAGAAGLSTAAALAKLGHEAVVLEQDDRIGAVWARRYERLRLHTVRRFSGLAHRPLPRDYPRYVPRDLYARYLEDYARHFGLAVQLSERVERVRVENAAGPPSWRIETTDAVWRAPVVVLATGHFNRPVLPAWPGRDRFRGRLLHSAEYTTGRDFAGERVLVVGLGNTGAEIATDLRESGAAHVAVAVRTPPPITRRDLAGVPVQLFGLALSRFPAALVDGAGAVLRRIGTGDLRAHGLAPAAWGPFAARKPPVIDVGFLNELKGGRVAVRPALAELTETGVVFGDGSEERFDAVVAATGFDTGLAGLVDAPGVLDAHGSPRFPAGEPTPHPGLYFVGFRDTVRGHLFEANRDSRRLARTIARYLEEAAA